MRLSLLSLVLSGGVALATAAACSSTPTTEEPVATATATATDTATSTATATATATATETATASATTTSSATAPASTSAPATSSAPAKKAWKDLTHDEKMAVMRSDVMPQMSKKFQEFDAKEFGKFECATCHGKGGQKANFKMPNPELPKLNPENNFAAHKKDQKWLDFMFQITPQMAGILNAAPWDPATKTGFGCFSCHTMKK